MRPELVIDQSWQFPIPETHQLANGLTVWLFHRPGQHVACAELLIPSGLACEPAHLEGVATIALNVCDEGTMSHPGSEFAELLESCGAAIGVNQSQYAAQIRLEVPASRLPQAWELLAEAVQQPAYSVSDVDHHKDILIADHAHRLASPRGASSLALRQALYHSSDRRSRPDPGTPNTLAQISAFDVRDFQRTWWGPAGTFLVIAGDLPKSTMADIEAAFSSWSAQQTRAALPPKRGKYPRTLIVDRPDAVQADILLAGFSIDRHDPRLAAAFVAGLAMSGSFSSRLNLELRERRGYTYGVGGGFSPGRFSGIFQVATSCRMEVAAQAVAESLQQLRLDKPFTADEVEAARTYLLCAGALENETASDLVDEAARLALSGSDWHYLHGLNASIAALEPGQVSRTFRELINPEELSLAITGPADVLAAELEAIGREPEIVELS